MSEGVLRVRAKSFAKDIVFLCRDLKQQRMETVLINQILRCGTSIGANIHEAKYAQGKKDFTSKFEIALKECYETEYWLELLFETECISKDVYDHFQNECGAIRRLLIASITTVKSK